MELSVALQLIRKAIPASKESQTWADLGSGRGLFTTALSTLLPDGSIIYAIDRDKKALSEVQSGSDQVEVKTFAADFADADLPFTSANGILLANAIHFVRDKEKAINKILDHMTSDGRILLIEYDTDVANPWVPFPISIKSTKNFVKQFPLVVEILEQVPSVYNRANIYSAVLTRL